jgi:hypothetical protein
MARKIFHHGIRISRIALEAGGVAVGILLLLLIVFLARISRGPIDVSFAAHYIEKALHDPVSGYNVRLGDVVLEWPHLRGALLLDLHDVRLVKNHQIVISVGRAQLGLSGIYLMAGRIAPISVVLSRPTLHLVRTETNDIRLSLEPAAETPEEESAESSSENPFMDVIKTLSAPAQSADAGSPVSHLELLRISDASMVVEDHALGITWFLSHLDLEFAKDRKGLAMTAGIRIPGGRKGDSIVHANAIYSRDTNDFHAGLTFQDFDPRIVSRKIDALAPLNGQDVWLDGNATAVVDAGLKIRKAALAVTSSDGTLNLPGIYAQPVPFQQVELQAAYDSDANTATVEKFSLRAPGVQAVMTAAFAINGGALKGPVTVSIPSLTQARLKTLWPETLKDSGAYDWAGRKVSDGAISKFTASLDLAVSRKPDKSWDVKATGIKSDFDIDGMSVDYRPPLQPVKHANGHAHFADDTLDIKVDSGMVGDMKVGKGRVVIDHVIAPDIIGAANITAHLDGKLTSVFNYVASEPINVDPKKIGLDLDRMKGAASLDVGVSFPTSKNLLASQVAVKVNGQLKDVLLPHVLKTMDLTADSLLLTIANGIAAVKGKGKLEGSNIAFEWQQYLESKGKPFVSRVEAAGDAGDDLRNKLGLGIADWVKGNLPVKAVYTEYPGRKADVTVDADATPGMLMIPPLNYVKAAGAAAHVKCRAVLQNGYLTEVNGLEAKAADLDISGGILTFGDREALRGAKIPRAKVQENDGALDLRESPDGALTLTFRGAFFDARPFLARRKKDAELYNGPAVKATIDAVQLRTRDGYVIKNAKAMVDMDKMGFYNQLDVDAVAGKGALALHLNTNEAGIAVLKMRAADAGATLQVFSIYDNVVGGTLDLNAQSKDAQHPHDLTGSAHLDDFRVIKAPALAQLVSVISPMGLPQLLSSRGIHFTKLESDVLWAMRRKGDVYVVTNGRTSGNSLGLTFAGNIDKQTDQIDITGDVVPVSEVNGLIGHIPLIGNILTGSKNGALFAATYALTGPIENPKVAVNPLSVLTPGILRRIFFEGGN